MALTEILPSAAWKNYYIIPVTQRILFPEQCVILTAWFCVINQLELTPTEKSASFVYPKFYKTVATDPNSIEVTRTGFNNHLSPVSYKETTGTYAWLTSTETLAGLDVKFNYENSVMIKIVTKHSTPRERPYGLVTPPFKICIKMEQSNLINKRLEICLLRDKNGLEKFITDFALSGIGRGVLSIINEEKMDSSEFHRSKFSSIIYKELINLYLQLYFINKIKKIMHRKRKSKKCQKIIVNDNEFASMAKELASLDVGEEFFLKIYTNNEKREFVIKNLEKIFNSAEYEFDSYTIDSVLIKISNLNILNKFSSERNNLVLCHPFEVNFEEILKKEFFSKMEFFKDHEFNIRNGIVKRSLDENSSRNLYSLYFQTGYIGSNENLNELMRQFLILNIMFQNTFLSKNMKFLYQVMIHLCKNEKKIKENKQDKCLNKKIIKLCKGRGKELKEAIKLANKINSMFVENI
uniref:Uncharacterized protein n=2 Tax=Strongyloides stercoralis TaxID=6248 RepID=A0AAF5I2Z3_STRER